MWFTKNIAEACKRKIGTKLKHLKCHSSNRKETKVEHVKYTLNTVNPQVQDVGFYTWNYSANIEVTII